MTPDQNNSTENQDDREFGSPTQPESSSSSPIDVSSWIMQGITRIHTRLDDIGKDVGDLKERVARVEENVKPIPQIDKRLRRVEHVIWTVFGAVFTIGVIWGAIKVLLSYFTITPKP